MMSIEEKYYNVGNAKLPWISFGTGVIKKYTRSPLRFAKYNMLDTIRSIKHLHINHELYGNLFINKILEDAYNSGFRLFDSGRIYGYSEVAIGKLFSKHDDICITTKCSAMDIERYCSPNSVNGNLLNSKKFLQDATISLYMLHWPEGNNWLEYYRDIYNEYLKGNCLSFGACNLSLEHLKKIQESNLPLPQVIQTELHPLNSKKELSNFCEEHHIQLMAHTPTGRMCQKIQQNSTLLRVSKDHNKSIAQIIIRWHFQHNVIPVVCCFSKNHMLENLDIFNFELSDKEMQSIDDINENYVILNSKGIDDPNYIYNL